MRLIIMALVVSGLTVGGFFGYKLYQRSQMKGDAIQYLETSVSRHSSRFSPDAKTRLMELLSEEIDEAFGEHYRSGGLTKPAEFDEILFTRVVYERAYQRSKTMDLDEQTKEYAEWMFSQSRPLSRRGSGGPDSPDEGEENESD